MTEIQSKSKTDATSSTERLLDSIRGKGDARSVEKGKVSRTVASPAKKPSSGATSIGIDIGYAAVTVVRGAKVRGKWDVSDYQRIPLPSGIDKGTEEFNEFLKSTVRPLCQGARKCQIWAVMSSTRAKAHIIRIPKVPDKYLATTIYWKLKKDVYPTEDDFFYDFKVVGESSDPEGGSSKLDVMCYSAPAAEVERFRNFFSSIEIPIFGISTPPLAIQNIFINDIIPVQKRQIACLFIGNSYSRVDLYSDKKLILSRDIKTGIDSMVHLLMDAGLAGEEEGLSHEKAQEILFSFGPAEEATVAGEEGGGLESNNLEKIVSPALQRLVRQIVNTFEYFTNELGQEKIERIYVSGMMPVNNMVLGYLSEHLGIETELFDPLKTLVKEDSLSVRTSLIPTFGVAISNNAFTPNYLLSYKDKQKTAYIKKFNNAILAGLIAMVIACSSVIAFEWRATSNKKAELAQLEQQQRNVRLVTRGVIDGMLSSSSQKQQAFVSVSKRYMVMAILSELSSLTPAQVGLTSFNFNLPEQSKTGAPEKSGITIAMEGVISGNRDTLDAELAAYVMKLRASLIFSDVTISKSTIDSAKKETHLIFALNLKTGQAK